MIVRLLALFLSAGLTAQTYSYRQYSVEDGLPDARVEQVAADSLGYVYARMAAGWTRFDGKTFEAIAGPPASAPDVIWMSGEELAGVGRRYLTDTPFAGTRLLDLAEDTQGRRWLATADAGLIRLLPSSFTGWSVGGAQATALLDYDDTLRVATAGRGVFARTGETLRPEVPDFGLEGIRITSLARDGAGRLCAATAGRGIVCRDSSGLVTVTQADGLPSNWVRSLVTRDTSLYVLTFAGELLRVAAGDSLMSVTRLPPPEGPSESDYTAMVPVADSALLLAGPRGRLVLWQPGRSRPLPGLPAGDISGMDLRRGRQLWVSVADRGLYYTDLTVEPLHFGRVIDDLLPDAAGGPVLALDEEREVWVGTGSGVSRISLDRQGQPLFGRHYGTPEGFPTPLGPGGAMYRDRNGQLWFANDGGLTRFLENGDAGYLPPPPTVLQAVTLFYDTITPGRREFRARENHLGFRFRAVDLSYPDRIRYRYRLSPLEPAWSPATAERSVRYAGLPGGSYTFTAAASTDGGRTWGDPARYAFTVESPLWLQPWFLILVVAVVSALIVGGVYTYSRRLLLREAALRRDLEERNQRLQLEQKALQLQMNPHFIFNALNGIRGLVDRAEAREQLSRFAALMRGVLHNSRQELITLAEEIRTVQQYLQMEQFCQPVAFTYRVEPPPGVDAEEVSLPPMLLQPFLENAILHGFTGLERPAVLEISFSMRGRRLRCLIQDSGVGRAVSERRRRDRRPGHQSVALSVTRERITAIGGTLDISDGPEYGTVVTLEIPVSYAW